MHSSFLYKCCQKRQDIVICTFFKQPDYCMTRVILKPPGKPPNLMNPAEQTTLASTQLQKVSWSWDHAEDAVKLLHNSWTAVFPLPVGTRSRVLMFRIHFSNMTLMWILHVLMWLLFCINVAVCDWIYSVIQFCHNQVVGYQRPRKHIDWGWRTYQTVILERACGFEHLQQDIGFLLLVCSRESSFICRHHLLGQYIRASVSKKFKLIKKAGSVQGTALEPLELIVERRLLHKLLN